MAKYAPAAAGLLLALLLSVSALAAMHVRLVSSAEATENTWTTKAPMQEARGYLGVAAVNGKIYAIGGFNGGGLYVPDFRYDGYVGTNEEYDPETDTWTFRTPMPTPRAGFATAVYQNKIYCMGGTTGIDTDADEYVLSGANEVYDPATGTWETRASMLTARWLLSANVVDGKIYLAGGQLGNGSSTGINEVYDPATDSWTTKTSMPSRAQDYGSAVVDTKIYVMGGFLGNLNQIYDVETDEWSYGASLPSDGRAAGATAGVMAPERIYVFGGGDVGVYDPENDSWAVGTGVPTSRFDMAVAVVNDTLYAVGGYIVYGLWNVMPVAVNEVYTPFGYGSDFTAPGVSVSSPRNETYYEADVSLSFTVDEPASWMGYSLDAEDNVTVAGNTTLTELPYGVHNLTVYAIDVAGNTGASEMVNFTIAEEPQPEPFPTTSVAAAAAVVSVAAVGVGLIVYFKKYRR